MRKILVALLLLLLFLFFVKPSVFAADLNCADNPTICPAGTSCLPDKDNPQVLTCQTVDLQNQYDSPFKSNVPGQMSPCGKIENGKCVSVISGLGIDLPTDVGGLISKILQIMLVFSGLIALIFIIISGYRFMVSQGNPEAVQEARDSLTSAVVGLLFIIFSLVILQLITVNILNIPGFSK